jgi:hypothetical protein
MRYFEYDPRDAFTRPIFSVILRCVFYSLYLNWQMKMHLEPGAFSEGKEMIILFITAM